MNYFWSSSNADPRVRAKDNGTVLHWACTSEKENRELVRLLLSKWVSYWPAPVISTVLLVTVLLTFTENMSWDHCNMWQWCFPFLLAFAIPTSCYDMVCHTSVEYYYSHRECKIDARDEDGNTPVHLAASQGHRGYTIMCVVLACVNNII